MKQERKEGKKDKGRESGQPGEGRLYMRVLGLGTIFRKEASEMACV